MTGQWKQFKLSPIVEDSKVLPAPVQSLCITNNSQDYRDPSGSGGCKRAQAVPGLLTDGSIKGIKDTGTGGMSHPLLLHRYQNFHDL